MLSKEKVRKKFLLIRKKKYFQVNSFFFKPLISLIEKKGKKNISLYYPSNYEVVTLKLFEILNLRKKIKTSLPVISLDGKMKFLKWKPKEPLKVNHFGFVEPIIVKKPIIPDLIIVPLLSYDKSHNRLGYGKGYYDKFLGKYTKKNGNILTIGLAFSFQEYKKIPTSNFDIKLDYILTEKGIF